jgi:hypothetical protein|tara:strand:+ start:271 stop:639 length:369 start_codon:yes stop_codon:yes gene_type:complete
MKNKTQILILFLMLLVNSTSTIFACGNSSEKLKMEKTSCSKEDNHTEKKSCCDNGEKEDDGCGGACDNSSCHCPTTVNIPVSFNDFDLSNSNNFTLLIKDCAYVQHIPKAIYLSIWQPPKIS